MTIILSVILTVILIIAGLFIYWSPGKVRPLTDQTGKPIPASISEKTFLEINGTRQGMFIKGIDSTKPVLLFLHGGPAMPEYAISREYATVMEKYFVVCWWDQRGSGLSFQGNISPDVITAEQIVNDTRQVTNYLRDRFKKDKIYLLGHSWGSYIGIKAALATPELYHAYIAVAQLTNQIESEKEAYRYMLANYKKVGKHKMVKKLENIPLLSMNTMPDEYRGLRDAMMHEQGIGTTHKMRSVISGIFMPVNKNPEYTLIEKINLWRGKWSDNSTRMWNQMLADDISSSITKLDLPVYFIHGIYDYTVSYKLAKLYFETLEAPMKGFYTFEYSAHSPIFEEPPRWQRIIEEDILQGKVQFADKRLILPMNKGFSLRSK